MSAGKGANEASYIKHEVFWSLSLAQFRIAMLFLRPGDRMAIVDMHAGDGGGVTARQPDLFRGSESTATALTAARLADVAKREDVICDVFLCERNRERRQRLAKLFPSARIIGNHSGLPALSRYRWVLVFNDPNGPRDHGDGVMRRIAMEVATSDFLIVVNESALGRIAGVTGVSQNVNAPMWSRDPASAAAVQSRYQWRSDPSAWAKMLNRNHVLRSKKTYGIGAMKGRFLLVTNKPQRPPRDFTRISVFGPNRAAAGPPEKSAPAATRGRDIGNYSPSG